MLVVKWEERRGDGMVVGIIREGEGMSVWRGEGDGERTLFWIKYGGRGHGVGRV